MKYYEIWTIGLQEHQTVNALYICTVHEICFVLLQLLQLLKRIATFSDVILCCIDLRFLGSRLITQKQILIFLENL